MKTRYRILAAAILMLPALASAAESAGPAASKPTPAATKGLPLHVPKDLRATHVHLGSWIVPEKGAPGQGFHDVYADARSVAAYRKDGRFPDGTLLVKEIRGIRDGALTTGHANWAGDTQVWFVMVRDEKGRYKSSPLWGDGWLWALYKADAPTTNVATSYAADCQGCHVPAAATDRVFVQGYPTLQSR